mmetsp:Transcript_33409/g.93768  ORF Transcript_33409/g.93768 Transcript_33409/m.93768 type:complete len:93 (+) Transcript_33409:63-341(+)
MHWGKAPGPSQIPVDIYKGAPSSVLKLLVTKCNRMLELPTTGRFPLLTQSSESARRSSIEDYSIGWMAYFPPSKEVADDHEAPPSNSSYSAP